MNNNNNEKKQQPPTLPKSITPYGIVDQVLNKILRSLINKHIKSLLVNPIQKSEFETRILESHNVKLKNVVFDQEKLKPKLAGLPFSFGMIKVAEIELLIPLDDIYNKPLGININGLEIEIMPNDSSSNNNTDSTSTSTSTSTKDGINKSNSKSTLNNLASSIYEDSDDDDDIEVAQMHTDTSSPLLSKLELLLKKILYNINVEIDNLSLFLMDNNGGIGSGSNGKSSFVEINIMKSKFQYIPDDSNVNEQQQQNNDDGNNNSTTSTTSTNNSNIEIDEKPKLSYFKSFLNMFSPSGSPNKNLNGSTGSTGSNGSGGLGGLGGIFDMLSMISFPEIKLPLHIAQFSFQQISIIYHEGEQGLTEKQRFYLFSTKKDDIHYIRIDDNHPNQDRINIQCEFKSSIYGNIDSKQLLGLIQHLSNIFLNTSNSSNSSNGNIDNTTTSTSTSSESSTTSDLEELKKEIEIENIKDNKLEKDIHIDILVPQISYYLHLPLFESDIQLSKPNFAIHVNGDQMRCYISRIAGFLNTEIHFESIDIDILPNGIGGSGGNGNDGNGRYNSLKISGTPAIKISKRLEVLSDSEIYRLYPINSSIYTGNPFFQSHSTSYHNDEHSIEEANRLSTCNITCVLPTIDLKLKKSDYENLISSFVLSSKQSTSTSIFTLFSTNANFQLLFEDMESGGNTDKDPIESFNLQVNRFDYFMAVGYPDEHYNPISSFSYISLDQINSYVHYYQSVKPNAPICLKPELFLTNQLVELKNHQSKNQFKMPIEIFEDYDDKQHSGGNGVGDSTDNQDNIGNDLSKDDYLYTYCDSLEFQDSKSRFVLGSICFVPSMFFINRFLNWIQVPEPKLKDTAKKKQQPPLPQPSASGQQSTTQENSIISLNNLAIHFGSNNSPRLKISSKSLIIFQLFDSGVDEVLQFQMYQTKISMREVDYKNQEYKTIGESYNSKDLLFLLKMNQNKKCSKIEIIEHSYDIRITKKEFNILKSLFPRFLLKLTSLMIIKQDTESNKNPETITQLLDKIDKIHINTDYQIDNNYSGSSSSGSKHSSSPSPSPSSPSQTANNNNNTGSGGKKKKVEFSSEIPNHQSSIPINFQIYIIDLVIYFHIIGNDSNSSIVLEAHISELVHTTYDQSNKLLDQQEESSTTEHSIKSIKDYDSLIVVNISSLLIRDNVSNYYQNLLGPLSHFQMIAIDDFEIDDSEKERKKKHQQQELLKQKENILSFIFATRVDSFNRTYHNLKLHISPLFLEFHQKSVDFLLYFFSSDENFNNFDFNDHASTGSGGAGGNGDDDGFTTDSGGSGGSGSGGQDDSEIYYDEFEIYPLQFKVDYKPSSISLTNHMFTKNGFVWVFQMIPLNDAYFTLPHIHIRDIGSKALSESIMSVYSPHLFGKNIFQYLGGVSPISIGIGIGRSILGLIIHPIKEAKDSENVIAGLTKGLGKGMKKITVELLTTSSKMTGFASKIFGKASHNQSIWTSQPENLTEGAKKGMSKIFDGFYNGVKSVIDPFSQSTGPVNFLSNMFWAVPGLLVNPILGISDGITFFSLGLRNSLDYTRIELERKKFKPKSILNHPLNNNNNNQNHSAFLRSSTNSNNSTI